MSALALNGEAAGHARQCAVRGRGRRDDPAPLLRNFNFHTLLRLPTGIFYKQGVKANVFLRQAAAVGRGGDQGPLDLRSVNESALHARKTAHGVR